MEKAEREISNIKWPSANWIICQVSWIHKAQVIFSRNQLLQQPFSTEKTRGTFLMWWFYIVKQALYFYDCHYFFQNAWLRINYVASNGHFSPSLLHACFRPAGGWLWSGQDNDVTEKPCIWSDGLNINQVCWERIREAAPEEKKDFLPEAGWRFSTQWRKEWGESLVKNKVVSA